MKKIISAISIFMAIFFLYASLTQTFEAFLQRTIFVGFCLVLVFLTKPAIKSHPRLSFWLLDIPLTILTIIPIVYASYDHYEIVLRVGESTQYDLILGFIFMGLVLEATRRAVGWPVFFLAMLLLIYTFYGPYFPSIIAHGGYTLREVIELNYMTIDGVNGIMIGVVADFIIIFIIFGVVLEKCGGVRRFSDLAQSLMGRQTGGAAKTAVIASAIMGSLSGSSAANVVTTGSFTIPMMKKLRYSPTFAGAVEAAASTGGQIMPPIMGASAFVIAGILGISYLAVCKAALLPAIFYFLSVGFCVHYVSKSMGLRGLPRDQLPPIKQSFIKGGILLIPIIVIMGMLIKGYSPNLAGFYAVVTIVIISFLQKETRLGLKEYFSAFSVGSLRVLNIAIVCASAGIIVSCFIITGLGMRISSIVAYIASYNVYLALLLAAVACIVLGMGMPTVGAYIIVATLSAPSLIDLGFSPIATHMFCFFYAILSVLTPPVALAAYAASPLAGEDTNPWRIGVRAFSFTLAAFILPFVFIMNNALILEGSFTQIVYSIPVVFIAILSLNIGLVGYCSRKCSILERGLFVIASALLFKGDLLTDMAGFCLFFVLCAMQRKEVIYQARKFYSLSWVGKGESRSLLSKESAKPTRKNGN